MNGHTIGFRPDSKVRTALHVSITDSGPSERVKRKPFHKMKLYDSNAVQISSKCTYGLARRSATNGSPDLLHASSLSIDNKTVPELSNIQIDKRF